jgi:hypothetical protein
VGYVKKAPRVAAPDCVVPGLGHDYIVTVGAVDLIVFIRIRRAAPSPTLSSAASTREGADRLEPRLGRQNLRLGARRGFDDLRELPNPGVVIDYGLDLYVGKRRKGMLHDEPVQRRLVFDVCYDEASTADEPAVNLKAVPMAAIPTALSIQQSRKLLRRQREPRPTYDKKAHVTPPESSS